MNLYFLLRKASMLLVCVIASLHSYGFKFSDFPGVFKDRDTYILKNQYVDVNRTVDPVKASTIFIHTHGLSFVSGANMTFGEPLLDGAGKLVYNQLGIPQVKSRMSIIECDGGIPRSVDNFNKGDSRFRGTANVKFYGVDFYQFLNRRSDWDIAGTGTIEFHNCSLTIFPHQYNHVLANPNIIVDGLVIDHRSGGSACEMTVRPNHPIRNLEIIDNHPGTNIRHFVLLRGAADPANPLEIYQLSARNICMYRGWNSSYCNLINPRATIRKSADGVSWRGFLQTFRDLHVTVYDVETQNFAKNYEFYIKRTMDGSKFELFKNITSKDKFDVRLLEFLQPHGAVKNNFADSSRYEWAILRYDKNIISGNHQVKLTNEDGTNSLLPQFLYEDISITEKNPFNLNFYNRIDSLNQLYDLVKNWKIQRENLNIPTLGTMPLEVVRQQINLAPGWNLILDKNQLEVFKIVGTTIYIKANKLLPSQKFTSITAPSGTISFVSDEYIEMPFTDKDRDSYVKVIMIPDSDKLVVKDKTGKVYLDAYGSHGFAYKSSASEKVFVSRIKPDLTQATQFYQLSRTGMKNTFIVSFLADPTVFSHSDRTKIINAPKNVLYRMEKSNSMLERIESFSKYLKHKLEKNATK